MDHQIDVGHPESEVQEHEDNKADPQVGGRHRGRGGLGRLHQALDDPGLAAALGQQPASRVHQKRGDGEPRGDQQEPLGFAQGLAADQPEAPQGEQSDERGQIGHDPHPPVLNEDVRDVVPWPVLLHVLRLQVVEALDLAVEVIGGEDREKIGYLPDLGGSLVVVPATDLENGKGAV